MFGSIKVFILIGTAYFPSGATEQFTTFPETYTEQQCIERGEQLIEQWLIKGTTYIDIECTELEGHA